MFCKYKWTFCKHLRTYLLKNVRFANVVLKKNRYLCTNQLNQKHFFYL